MLRINLKYVANLSLMTAGIRDVSFIFRAVLPKDTDLMAACRVPECSKVARLVF